HFFEPHEPYVAHPEHPFGTADVDRYDSEVAAADEGIGTIVNAIRSARPGAIVLATADHGEEFGEHGGRYHGTTVYEEQARVPLIIDGPGVSPGVTASAVQTIDLLPTVLSALGIPRPARLRGRDLGPLLAGKAEAKSDPGLAFAETDEYTLLARGNDRLVCARRAAACSLFDRARDPLETHDVAAADPLHTRELRRMLTTLASEHGRFEHGEEASWPEALRRGIAGDVEAAADVATLLDDVNAAVRVKAAEVSYDLHAQDVVPAMRRAAAGDAGAEDDPVRRWCSLALVRMGEPANAQALALLRDPDPPWRRAAALAFAERGDGRGAADLAAWWSDSWDEHQNATRLPFVRATEILAALAKIRARAAVAPLVRSLADVRLRPFVADALATVGDPSAREPLGRTLASEPQVTTRAREARALLALGGASWTPRGDAGAAPTAVDVDLDLPKRDPNASGLRLIALTANDAPCEVHTSNSDPAPSTDLLDAHAFDLPVPPSGRKLHVQATSPGGLAALFLLPAPARQATQELADGGSQ
ncbi:MAG TPA: sulfatase-like hydrolase/transferase, partial [Polyangiaceae bacterium]